MAASNDSTATNALSVAVPTTHSTSSASKFEPRHGQHRLDRRICGQKTHSFSNLCEKCKSIFDEWPRVLDAFDRGEYFAEYDHWENVVLFEEAASRDCHLCILFLSQFKESEIEEARRILNHGTMDALNVVVLTDYNQSRRGDLGSWSLTLNLPLTNGVTISTLAMFPTSTSAGYSVGGLPSSIWSGVPISLAKWWLRTCREFHHETCGVRPVESINPTRLIAVNGQPRLVLSKDLPGLVNYTTLSHCWGSLKVLRLVRSNFSALQQGIPWNELCKTFQDACIVTQSLEFEYLWIDSLCIIQDDPKDWERESLLMSTVYGCSSLNIAAASAKDGSMGCFLSRNPKCIQKIQLCLKESRNQTSKTLESLTSQTATLESLPPLLNDWCEGTLYDCAPQALHKECISDSPLGKRAWVLQERVLSHRTLHFSSQLFWECKGSLACETFPDYLPGIFRWINEDLNTADHSEHWFALIRLYSHCRLTFGKDKLIAISGVAQSLERRYDDQYLAGLWRRDLLRQLRWRMVGQPGGPQDRPITYRAPSWSWASVDGGVYFNNYPITKPLIEILDVHVEPLGDSIFGDIREGTLRLRCGHLVVFTLATYQVHSSLKYIINSGGRSFKCNMAISFDCLDAVISAEYYLLSASRGHCLDGYVIEATHREQGQYRRVGVFGASPQNEEEEKIFRDLQNAAECLAPDSAYANSAPDDEFGNKRFVITII